MASIVYYSLTGQTRRFINKVQGFDTYEISSAVAPVTMTEPFIMVIPSYENGRIMLSYARAFLVGATVTLPNYSV